MRRYDPNPTFLTKASGIKQKRHTRALIAFVIVVVLSLATVFVMWGVHMQSVYKEQFPDMVGAATSKHTKKPKEETTSEESSEEETSEETTTESSFAPVVPGIETMETAAETEETTQNNNPDPLPSYTPVEFLASHPIQSVSHEERDMMLEGLQQDVLYYINANPDERISFRYINLASNETLGINDLTPIIPAGAYALPAGITYCEGVASGLIIPTTTATYLGEGAPGNNSWITENYQPGKAFYLGTCMTLSITHNDSLAYSYLLNSIGGTEAVWDHMYPISGYINYTGSVTYEDYTGTILRGSGRTCVYDLAAYMEYLYYSYINDYDTYLPLIGAMEASEVPCAFTSSFADGTRILHISGRNEESHSYTDVAIIDGDEPVILVISCECSSYDRANTIMAALSGYLDDFLSACHQ
ncbi:Beta-lactamase enzyme family protein [Oscillospiraceae bacterium]|nr:Beta-lactamase enzyme family protein [Oscillospiraceae bacterium]